MKLVGNDLLDYLRDARQRLDFLEQRVQRWSIACGDDVIEALFLPRSEPAVSDAELLAPLAGRVASWWIPDAVVRLDAMPLAPTGKIDKMQLRAEYGQV